MKISWRILRARSPLSQRLQSVLMLTYSFLQFWIVISNLTDHPVTYWTSSSRGVLWGQRNKDLSPELFTDQRRASQHDLMDPDSTAGYSTGSLPGTGVHRDTTAQHMQGTFEQPGSFSTQALYNRIIWETGGYFPREWKYVWGLEDRTKDSTLLFNQAEGSSYLQLHSPSAHVTGVRPVPCKEPRTESQSPSDLSASYQGQWKRKD